MHDISLENFNFMEKGELQRVCHELFKKFEEFKNSSNKHLHRLKDFETEKDCLITKIKSLEDALINSTIPLENSPNSTMSFYKVVASSSHAMLACRTMFVKPSMS
jgi:hypothetical protein